MHKKHYIIINPAAGKSYAEKQKKQLLEKLTKLEDDFEVAYTNYAKQEIEIVQKAIQQGYRKIISVGGDGTLHHIINGVFLQTEVPTTAIEIAVIPLGTGNDWIKQYQIPNDIEKAIQIINKKKTQIQDIGEINIEEKTSYFNNVTGIGLDGYVVKSLEKYRKFGAASYFIASLMGFIKYKKSTLKFHINQTEITTKTLLAAIGICGYCGNGMRLTSQVDTTDGLFDISIIKDISMLNLIRNIKKMYNGKLEHHKKVETYKTTTLKIEVEKGEKPYIQADGELIGQGEIKIKIIPKSINFVVA